MPVVACFRPWDSTVELHSLNYSTRPNPPSFFQVARDRSNVGQLTPLLPSRALRLRKLSMIRSGPVGALARSSTSCPWPALQIRALSNKAVVPRLLSTSRPTPRGLLHSWQTYRSPIQSSTYPKIPPSLARYASTKPPVKQRSRLFRYTYHFFAYTGGFILVASGFVAAFFIYDASTYRSDLSFSEVPVSEQALMPRKGGPKNLPIAEALVDDDDSPEAVQLKTKPKLVILGTGWGSVALLKTLNPEDYHITVVSPVNHFLFTPMLPSGTVGTLELRSLCEPVRRIVQRVKGHFLKAEAVEVEFSEKLVEVAQLDAKGVEQRFYLPYDKLVIGVGRQIRTIRESHS